MRPNHAQVIAMLLAAMPATRRQLAEITGLAHSTVVRNVRDLHKAGDVHITAYQHAVHTNQPMPVYTAGSGKDVKSTFKAKGQKVYSRRWYRKMKAEGAHEERNARRRARRAADRAKTGKPKPWFAALPGAQG